MAPISAAHRSWRRRVFSATWLSYACYYFCRKPFYIAKPVLEGEMGWSAELLGLLGASYLIAYALGQFVSAWLGDRWGPRVLVLAGMVISAGANLVFGFSNSTATFAVFMVVNGLAQATGWCGNVAAMAPWFKRRERGTVMGLWATNFQVGGVAANALAAYALGAWGFRWSFVVGSAVLLAASGWFLLHQRNRPEDLGLAPMVDDEEEEAGGGGRSRWSRQVWTNVLLVGSFYFFIKFIRYALWSWAPYLLHSFYGMEPDEAGYLSTIFDLSGIFGVLALGVVSDRLFRGRRTYPSFLFILVMVASCAALYLAGGTSPVLFGVCIGFIGFSLYGPDAIMTSAGAIEVSSPRSAALAAGIINGMGAVGAVVQELLLGRMLTKSGMTPVFATLVVSSLCAAALLGVMLVRNKRGQADL